MSNWTNKRNLIFTLLFALFLTSCGGGDGNNTNNNTGNKISDYQGTYTGQFTGTETGTWEIIIDASGNVTGTAITTTLPVTTIPLSGTVDTSGSSTLISGTAGIGVSFMITISNGTITGNWTDSNGGSGVVTGNIKANTTVTGFFTVGVEIFNYTFTPLKVIDLTDTTYTLSITNNQDPVNPTFYDSHGLAIILNPLNNTIAAISYSYFNTGSGAAITEDYLFLRDCSLTPCTSVSLDLNNRTLTFTNTNLPVDKSTAANRPNVTNIATMPATINGSVSW
ncbi:MAG: hypothetical protein ACC657_08120 [Thiohalomonadales bacterium]